MCVQDLIWNELQTKNARRTLRALARLLTRRTSRFCSLSVACIDCRLAECSRMCDADGSEPARSTKVMVEYFVEPSGLLQELSAATPLGVLLGVLAAGRLRLSTMMVTI
jgi:hypothetical protein